MLMLLVILCVLFGIKELCNIVNLVIEGVFLWIKFLLVMRKVCLLVITLPKFRSVTKSGVNFPALHGVSFRVVNLKFF